jgi:hypothetical protein
MGIRGYDDVSGMGRPDRVPVPKKKRRYRPSFALLFTLVGGTIIWRLRRMLVASKMDGIENHR